MASESPAQANSHVFYFSLAVFALLLIVLTTVFFYGEESTVPAFEKVHQPSAPSTVAEAWQWSANAQLREYVDELDVEEREELRDNSRVAATINEQAIVAALAEVRIDEAGNVVIDELGLQALYGTMGYSAVNMSDAQRRYIGEVIRDGLPNPAADQVVSVVDSFYEYLQSKEQLESAYSGGVDPFSLAIKIEDLQTLRRMHFGDDIAERLFARQHAQELYMLENLKLVQDDNLSEDDKAAQRSQLKERYLARDFGITNWRERRDGFLAQKDHIVNSALSAEQKTLQVEQLFDEAFTLDEQRAIASQRLTEF